MNLPAQGHFRVHACKTTVNGGVGIGSHVYETRFGGDGKTTGKNIGNLSEKDDS